MKSAPGEKWIVFAAVMATCAIRLVLLERTFDFPGDGPSRALLAWDFAQHPRMIWSGYWVPAHTYLGGIAVWIVKDPLVALRFMNCLFAAATVPVLYALSRKVLGVFPAIFAVFVFALLPMHVGLSISSLTEVSGVFFLLCAVWLFMEAALGQQAKVNQAEVAPVREDSRANDPATAMRFSGKSSLCLGLACGTLLVANMIRCETWLYIPILLGYFFVVTRRVVPAFCAAAFLAMFPLVWMYNCYADYGQPFLSLSPSLDPRNNQFGFFDGLSSFSSICISVLGPAVYLVGVYGVLKILVDSKGGILKEDGTAISRLLLSAIVLLQLVLDVGLCMSWGDNIQLRYLISFFVFVLPVAGYGFMYLPWFGPRIRVRELERGDGGAASGSAMPARSGMRPVVGGVMAILVAVNFMLGSFLVLHPDICVTTEPWREVHSLCRFLETSEAVKGKQLIFTSMNYRSKFIPLIYKDCYPRHYIAQEWWTPLLDLRGKMEAKPPEILATCDTDGADLCALLSVCDFQIDRSKPLYSKDSLSVYEIIPGTFKVKRNVKMPPCLWYPEPGWRTLYQKLKLDL